MVMISPTCCQLTQLMCSRDQGSKAESKLRNKSGNAFQEEVRNVGKALGTAVILHRAEKYQAPGKDLADLSQNSFSK
jgi:hypothetical protein